MPNQSESEQSSSEIDGITIFKSLNKPLTRILPPETFPALARGDNSFQIKRRGKRRFKEQLSNEKLTLRVLTPALLLFTSLEDSVKG